MARVSSTTPRLGPRCPPVWLTCSIKNARISSASSGICSAGSALRSPGLCTELSRAWDASDTAAIVRVTAPASALMWRTPRRPPRVDGRRPEVVVMSVVLPSLAWRIHRRPRHVESAGQTVRVPELPEVESARAAIEAAALDRKIVDVDDSDGWVCRPHHPGEIREALVGRRLTAANRRGKSMACETSGVGRSRSPGPELGIHLGMSGRILIMDADGASTEGGDWLGGRYARAADAPNRKPIWDRFTITFADGGTLRLFDKRRLGRVRLDPELDRLGPDAEMITARGVRGPHRPQRGSGQGPTAGPERHRRRRQPARRRNPVAGPDLAAPARQVPAPRTSCPGSAGRCARRPRRRSSTAVSIPAGSSSTARPADTARVAGRR